MFLALRSPRLPWRCEFQQAHARPLQIESTKWLRGTCRLSARVVPLASSACVMGGGSCAREAWLHPVYRNSAGLKEVLCGVMARPRDSLWMQEEIFQITC